METTALFLFAPAARYLPLRPAATTPPPLPPLPPVPSPGMTRSEEIDLIHFYNNVYIKQMRPFALRYSPSPASAAVSGRQSFCCQGCERAWIMDLLLFQGDSPPLVPYPSLRTGSPRRMLLSSKHSIYISPHQSSPAASPSSPRDKMCYYICSSPPHVRRLIPHLSSHGSTVSLLEEIILDWGVFFSLSPLV